MKSESSRPDQEICPPPIQYMRLPHGSLVFMSDSENTRLPSVVTRMPRIWSPGTGGRFTLSNVSLGNSRTRTTDPMRRSSQGRWLSMTSSPDPANEIATPGMPSDNPSIAAATVPANITSSPMLGPWLIPENTKSGRGSRSAPNASNTQSVGVPSTWNEPSGRLSGRSGRVSVSEWLVPLCSRSGATTVTVATVRHTSASRARRRARIPSSLLTRMFNGGLAVHDVEDGPQLMGEVFDGLVLERCASLRFQGSGSPVLVHALSRPLDGVLLRVQQMLDQQDQFDLAPLVHPVTGPVLGGIEKPELALPVAQHVGLEVGELADVTDGEELLDRSRDRHRHCSAFNSRSMRSAMARRGDLPSNRIWETSDAMGSSMPVRRPSSTAARAV